ncbi:MAG: SLC13 family permease [Alphaproteobacteria bacterium]|nr:SLC13 family permease [Alphaproteobacteria bacterium]
MELLFLLLLILLMAVALGSGYPVAFALPGSAILTIFIAALCGYLFAGDTDAFFVHGGPAQWLSAGVNNLRGVYWQPERDTLIAIPLFIFMGIMLQRSRIAEDLLITMAQLFGPIPGGLGISVVFVGALLAATTGIVGATVVAMGLISLPAMLKNNYSKPLATGTIAASGTLGQIIPPSIVLIILADQLAGAADQAGTARKALYKEATGEISMPTIFEVGATSAGEMFLGAFLPGLLLVGLYMLFILIYAFFNPKAAPAVRYDGKYNAAFALKVFITLVPPLALILLVLGSIVGGIATVNQAGAIGAAGATVMAGYRLMEGKRRAYAPALLALGSLAALAVILSLYSANVKSIHSQDDMIGVVLAVIAVAFLVIALVWSGWRAFKIDNTLYGVMIETAKTTSLVFIILLGAAMLTAAFRAFGGEELVREFLTSLPGGFWLQFLVVMLVIFVLGFFLDFIEIAVVVVPIVAPILLADPGANITAVWLGVMIGLNIQTSFLTPPFGFALFYLRGVADATVRTIEMYKGVIAFIGLQLLALVVVALTPSLVNYLPNRVALLSETAPPPRNPRLQYCIEQYVFDHLNTDGDRIRAALGGASALDTGFLPEDVRDDLNDSLDGVENTFDLIKQTAATEAALIEAAPAFRPIHDVVREIERDIRKLEERMAEDKTLLSRTRGDDEAANTRRQRFERNIAALEADIEVLKEDIPAEWDDTYSAYRDLQKADSKARLDYRRNVDDAYNQLVEIIGVIDASDALAQSKPRIEALRDVINNPDPEAAAEQFKSVADSLNSIAGAGEVKSLLSKARRALRARTPDPEKAAENLEEAIALVDSETQWREQALTDLRPALATLEVTIRDTIGLRQQDRLPREIALFVASCNSGHRDISLNF